MNKLVLFLFTCIYIFSIRIQAQENSQIAKIQILETDSITPVIGATITLSTTDNKEIKMVSNENGYLHYNNNFKYDKICITYLGEIVLTDNIQSKQPQNKYFLDINSIKLDSVSVIGNRRIVKRLFDKDVVKIKNIEIFENQGLTNILSLLPGLIIDNSGKISYMNYSVTGIRFGDGGKLLPVNEQTLKSIQAIRAENLDDIILKKQFLDNTINYEIIINTKKEKGVYFSPAIDMYMGKKMNATANTYTQITKGKFNNILLFGANTYRTNKDEYVFFENIQNKTITDFNEDVNNYSANIDYNGELEIDKNTSIGGVASLYFSYGKNIKVSNDNSYIGTVTYNPDKSLYQKYSLFFNYATPQNKIHWEASINNDFGKINIYENDILKQKSIYKSFDPNTTLDYSFINESKTLKISTRFAYSFLKNRDMEEINSINNQFSEHVAYNSSFISWEKEKFYLGAGLNTEYSKNKYLEETNFMPKISIGYNSNDFSTSIDYNRVVSRPLSFMLRENNIIQNSQIIKSGNSKLRPKKTQEIALNLSYKDFGITLSNYDIKDIYSPVPVGYTKDGLLIRRWENIGRSNTWNIFCYYVFKYKWLYMKPYISGRFGKFYDGQSWIGQKSIDLSLPIQIKINQHRINIDCGYYPKSKNLYYEIINDMYSLDIGYSYTLPSKNIVIKIYGNDILNSVSNERRCSVDGKFPYNNFLKKDMRTFGISFSYTFSSGETKNIDGVINNQTRK